MRAKTTLCSIMAVIVSVLHCQPTISNAEDFSTGMVFKYLACHTSGVDPGNAGPNITWNFSGLTVGSGTVTESILSLSATAGGSIFPASTFVEQFSDGTSIYITKTAGGNYMDGMTTSNGSYSMSASKSVLVSLRTLSMGTTASDTFSNTFTAGGFNFIGMGTVTATSDAYGTLILPTKTYSNTLRIKILQMEVDSMPQFGSVSTSTYVTFMWFNGINPAALLSIDSLSSSAPGAPPLKNVRYLIHDNSPTTGIDNYSKTGTFGFYPNPAQDELTILSGSTGELQVISPLGEILETRVAENRARIPIGQYPAGIYQLTFKAQGSNQCSRLIISR